LWIGYARRQSHAMRAFMHLKTRSISEVKRQKVFFPDLLERGARM